MMCKQTRSTIKRSGSQKRGRRTRITDRGLIPKPKSKYRSTRPKKKSKYKIRFARLLENEDGTYTLKHRYVEISGE